MQATAVAVTDVTASTAGAVQQAAQAGGQAASAAASTAGSSIGSRDLCQPGPYVCRSCRRSGCRRCIDGRSNTA